MSWKALRGYEKVWFLIGGLCIFVFLLNFKPSEPYLSQYLICNQETQEDYCSSFKTSTDCSVSPPCEWSAASQCGIVPCSNVTYSQCGNDDYNYCEQDSNQSCTDVRCYLHFTDDEVNNDIYPWATYAYLPFLLTLGPFAELFSYRLAILFGLLGRGVARMLLIYGRSLLSMQIMEVAYALGTAAEDVFSAFVYYAVHPDHYQRATSYLKATALSSCVISGILGDLLVVLQGTSIRLLMWISAVSVWIGFVVGLGILRSQAASSRQLDYSALTQELSVEDPRLKIWSDETATQRQTLLDIRGASPRLNLTTAETMQNFRMQLECLRHALHDGPTSCMLALWVMGNAVFTVSTALGNCFSSHLIKEFSVQTVYNYEVAIFEELAGSNQWNGSVLAVLLLAGAVGAMMPSWMSPLSPSMPHQQSTTREEPELIIANRLIVATGVAVFALLAVVSSWSLQPSMMGLTVYFASWYFVNAIVYAQLALRLKTSQSSNQRLATSQSTVYSPAAMHAQKLALSSNEDGNVEGDDSEDHASAYSLRPSLGAARYSALNSSVDHTATVSCPSTTDPADSSMADPPFSLAIVLIVATSVAVQVVLQGVLFSALGLSLHFVVWILALISIVTALCYFCAVVWMFGLTSLGREWVHSVRWIACGCRYESSHTIHSLESSIQQ